MPFRLSCQCMEARRPCLENTLYSANETWLLQAKKAFRT
jgi:hypothetical protein